MAKDLMLYHFFRTKLFPCILFIYLICVFNYLSIITINYLTIYLFVTTSRKLSKKHPLKKKRIDDKKSL